MIAYLQAFGIAYLGSLSMLLLAGVCWVAAGLWMATAGARSAWTILGTVGIASWLAFAV